MLVECLKESSTSLDMGPNCVYNTDLKHRKGGVPILLKKFTGSLINKIYYPGNHQKSW